MTPQRPSPLKEHVLLKRSKLHQLYVFGGQKLIFIQRLFVLCPATHKVKFPYQKFPCTRPSSVVRNMSMEGTHHLPTLYNAMQCSVRRATGNMSMEGTHPLPTQYNAMQCSVRRAPGNMSMEGTHHLPTLYNAMQCSVRRAPGNMSMEGTPPPPPPPPPSHPVQCHAVQCQEGTR